MADYDPVDPDKCCQLIDIPDELAVKNYAIEIGSPQTIISPSGDEEFELQSLTVVIKRDNKQLLIMSDYRVGKVS